MLFYDKIYEFDSRAIYPSVHDIDDLVPSSLYSGSTTGYLKEVRLLKSQLYKDYSARSSYSSIFISQNTSIVATLLRTIVAVSNVHVDLWIVCKHVYWCTFGLKTNYATIMNIVPTKLFPLEYCSIFWDRITLLSLNQINKILKIKWF